MNSDLVAAALNVWSEKVEKAFTIVRSTKSLQLRDLPNRQQISMASDGNYASVLGQHDIFGIFPIGMKQFFEISSTLGHHASNYDAVVQKVGKVIQKNIAEIVNLQSQKETSRKDHLGTVVNDHWGTMNPENLFVLAMLVSCRMQRLPMNQPESIRGLFLGTGSGFPEKMCLDIWKSLCEHESWFKIDTVDIKQHFENAVFVSPHQTRLDGRNYSYGPLPGLKIGHCIDGHDFSRNVSQYHQDSRQFLSEKDKKEEYDFIVIDANHLYEAVMDDLKLSYPRLKRGGFIFLDDFGGNKTATNPGVTAAAFTFAHKKKITGYWVSNPTDPFATNSAFFIKS